MWAYAILHCIAATVKAKLKQRGYKYVKSQIIMCQYLFLKDWLLYDTLYYMFLLVNKTLDSNKKVYPKPITNHYSYSYTNSYRIAIVLIL